MITHDLIVTIDMRQVQFINELFVNPTNTPKLLKAKYQEAENFTELIPKWTRSEYKEINDDFREKNRYLFRVPCSFDLLTRQLFNPDKLDESNRIKLQYSNSSKFDEYINASPLEFQGMKYIAAQAPLPETFGDFWNMVWEQGVLVIIMLVVLQKNRCEKYWPDSNYSKREFSGLSVYYDGETVISPNHLLKRAFQITKNGISRQVVQFHYLSWPDHGVPSDPTTLRLLLDIYDRSAKYKAPVLVHCSAGVGRTGTFCVIDAVISYLENCSNASSGDIILEIIKRFREQRNGIVETEEQFYYIYHFLYFYFNEKRKQMSLRIEL